MKNDDFIRFLPNLLPVAWVWILHESHAWQANWNIGILCDTIQYQYISIYSRSQLDLSVFSVKLWILENLSHLLLIMLISTSINLISFINSNFYCNLGQHWQIVPWGYRGTGADRGGWWLPVELYTADYGSPTRGQALQYQPRNISHYWNFISNIQ